MLAGLVLRFTGIIASLGLGEWVATGPQGVSLSRVPRSYALPPEQEDPEIVALSEEIEAWMSQPSQNASNLPPHLRQVLMALNNTAAAPPPEDPDRIFRSPDTVCTACTLLVKMIIGYSRFGGPVDIMADFLVKVCYIVGYQSMAVCRGLIHQDKYVLDFIIRKSDATAEDTCSLLLGSYGCGPYQGPRWTVPIPPYESPRADHVSHPSYRLVPPGKRSVHDRSYDPIRPKDQSLASGMFPLRIHNYESLKEEINPFSDAPKESPKAGKKVLKVLHLTDPHYDPSYRVGANAICEAPLCCNQESGPPRRPEEGAGKWGDYRNCDSPRWLLQHMLHHIKTTHPDVDYFLCTGDLVPHHIWRISRSDNVEVMQEVSKMLKDHFPDVPIYGAIGNHESFPRDSFPPPEVPEVWSRFGIQWLYDTMSDQWERLMMQPIPDSSRYGAYYSVLAKPDLRIISINTNYCYILNWWVLYKSVDPGHVLAWLVGELQKAERNGEMVHIIGHVPPFYSDCFPQWRHQYSRIVSRFAHIIRGQFYGHSHLDEFRLHFDVRDPERAVGVQYISPNNGPFHDLNPSYRLFYVDGDYEGTTRNVLDYETWAMNLTHANMYDAPHWYLLYTAKKDLRLPSLSPKHWSQFVHQLVHDRELFDSYYRFQIQDSDVALRKGCNEKCRRDTICAIVDGDEMMPRKCGPLRRR